MGVPSISDENDDDDETLIVVSNNTFKWDYLHWS